MHYILRHINQTLDARKWVSMVIRNFKLKKEYFSGYFFRYVIKQKKNQNKQKDIANKQNNNNIVWRELWHGISLIKLVSESVLKPPKARLTPQQILQSIQKLYHWAVGARLNSA